MLRVIGETVYLLAFLLRMNGTRVMSARLSPLEVESSQRLGHFAGCKNQPQILAVHCFCMLRTAADAIALLLATRTVANAPVRH